jgi:uncharacterized protein YdaU (DUF1376 family)
MANGGRWHLMMVPPAALTSDRLYFSDREYAAYMMWIWHAWQQDGHLLADPKYLSQIALCSPGIAKQALEAVLNNGLGAVEGGRLKIKHVSNDIERAAQISKQRSTAARSRWDREPLEEAR